MIDLKQLEVNVMGAMEHIDDGNMDLFDVRVFLDEILTELRDPVNQERINESLDNAVNNDYDIWNDSADVLACDLVNYDVDFEDADLEVLVPFVQVWKNKQMNKELTKTQDETGFLFNGTWIENSDLSECGRFEVSAAEYYGEEYASWLENFGGNHG